MTVVKRWKFADAPGSGVESWTHPTNPKSASSPFGGKVIATAAGADLDANGIHRTRVFQAPSTPVEWEFGGSIYSKDHRDKLRHWAQKDNVVRVSDHLGRTFEVIIRQLDVVDKRSPNDKWRQTYTMRVLVLRRVA